MSWIKTQRIATRPRLIMLDCSWINDIKVSYGGFFHRIPLKMIIPWFAVLPPDVNADDVIWNNIEAVLGDEDTEYDWDSVQVMLETVQEEYYARLNNMLGADSDYYLFHNWVAPNSFLVELNRNELL